MDLRKLREMANSVANEKEEHARRARAERDKKEAEDRAVAATAAARKIEEAVAKFKVELPALLEHAAQQGQRTLEVEKIADNSTYFWVCGKQITWSFWSHSHSTSCFRPEWRLIWDYLNAEGLKPKLKFHEYQSEWASRPEKMWWTIDVHF
jgi:hypothetical protein